MRKTTRPNRRSRIAAAVGVHTLACTFGFAVSMARAAPLPVIITVDAAANHHPISPLIYGLNFASTAMLNDLQVPINRAGGNSASTYNWQRDARNTGMDWFFESVPIDSKDPFQYNTRFVAATREGHALSMVTIPMIGRVARLDADGKPLASFSIAKYGKQKASDVNGMADAGNGIGADGTAIANDPNDASIVDDPANEQARVNALVQAFGRAGTGGVRYYAMDNEPSLWHLNHRDIHPEGAHASEIANKVIAYSRAVKAVDPGARIVAPEEWGWTGYHLSGFDQQYAAAHGMNHLPDRDNETGGMDYVPWLLTQWKQAGHPVDVFSLHFYPQGGEFTETKTVVADTPAIELSRNRSTRTLWDTTYKDPSWINSVVALIPLMRQWVDTYYYPGTPIALTEYNWGGDATMNGATTQADVLGIFGREGLDIATRWGALTPDMPVYKAFKLYRNYDGKGGGFGTTSVADVQHDPDRVSSFAALRDRDRVLTIIVVNKQLDQSAEALIPISHFAVKGKVEVWQLADNAITRQSDISAVSGQIQSVMPAKSVTLFVLHGAVTR